MERAFNRINTKFTPEQIQNPTDEIKAEIHEISQDMIFDIISKKSVWFMITQLDYDEYYNDNEYKHADGEDL